MPHQGTQPTLERKHGVERGLLDRDILQLADHGRADDIAGTPVLETWFDGRRVFSRGSTARPAAGRMGVTS